MSSWGAGVLGFMVALAMIAAMGGLWLLFLYGLRRYADHLRLTKYQREQITEGLILTIIVGGTAYAVIAVFVGWLLT